MPSLINDGDRLSNMMDFKMSILYFWKWHLGNGFEDDIDWRFSIGHCAHIGPNCFLHLIRD